jgi:hypothetical protein
MATIASDNCTDTDFTDLDAHTPSGGGSWAKNTAASGAAKPRIIGNRMHNINNSQYQTWLHSVTPSSADYDVSWTIDIPTADNSDFAGGPTGRIHATQSTFYGFRYNQFSDLWELWKRVNSTTDVVIDSYSGDVPGIATPRVAKLVMSGTTIEGYVGGVLRCNVTDSDISAVGSPGFNIYGFSSETQGHAMDDFLVEEAGGGGGGTNVSIFLHHLRQQGIS